MNLLGIDVIVVRKTGNPVTLYSIRRELENYVNYVEIDADKINWPEVYDRFMSSSSNYLCLISDRLIMAPLSLLTIYMTYFPILEMTRQEYGVPNTDANYVLLFRPVYRDMEIEDIGAMVTKSYAVKLRNQHGAWNILERSRLARFNHTFHDIASPSGCTDNFLKYGAYPFRNWFVPEGIRAVGDKNCILAMAGVIMAIYFNPPWRVYSQRNETENIISDLKAIFSRYFGKLYQADNQAIVPSTYEEADLIVLDKKLQDNRIDVDIWTCDTRSGVRKPRVIAILTSFYDNVSIMHLQHAYIDELNELGFTTINHQILARI